MKRNHRSLAKQLTALGISAILVGTVPVFAIDNHHLPEVYKTVSSYQALKQLATSSGGVEKEETVYGILNSDGSTHKVIVSDYIHSNEKLNSITINSNLESLTDLQKSDVPVINGDQVTWNMNGYELNYQGVSNQSLPVDTKVTYFLDGNEVKSSDLDGKSGQLKIVIEQTNNQFEEVNISGKTRKLYVPYYSLTTMRLSSDIFENVHINQGKVISDGKNFLVTGLLAPGMNENFEGIVDLKLVNTLEITAEMTDFEFSPIYMALSDQLPEMDSIDALDELSSLSASLSEFKAAGDSLVIGATDFEAGTTKYFENFGGAVKGLQDYFSSIVELSSKLGGMVSPVERLTKGAVSLHEGLLKWKESAKPLVEGYTQFSEGTKAFSDGAKALGEKVSVLNESLTKLSSSTALLSASSVQINQGISDLNAHMTQLSGGSDQLYDAMKQFQKSLDPNSTNYAAYDAILKQMETMNASTKAVSQGLGSLSEKEKQFNHGLGELAQKTTALAEAPKLLAEGATKLTTASSILVDNAAKLQIGTDQFLGGMSTLISGSETLANGMTQFNAGIGELSAKLPALQNGTKKLSEGFKTLDENSVQLTEGAKKLKDGVEQFNEEGVKALVEKVSVKSDKIDEAVAIKDALVFLANKNNSFSGINEDMISKVNYVFKITNKIEE